jgi:ribose transport system ATP-binding protein
MHKRVALIPPQREVQAVVGDASVLWNASLTTLKDLRVSRTPFLSLTRERQQAQAALDRLNVVPRDLDAPITALSGGNQQKVIFARAMLQGADAFVLCEPTRGVDVRTRREIYALINDLRASGKAILVASSDVEDVLATSDVVHFVENGRLGPELATASDNLRSKIDLM